MDARGHDSSPAAENAVTKDGHYGTPTKVAQRTQFAFGAAYFFRPLPTRRRGEDRNMSSTKKAATPSRFIFRPDIIERIGVTYPTIWTWMREGKFPRSRDLGGRSAWIESEVEAWIKNRPVRRLKGDEAA